VFAGADVGPEGTVGACIFSIFRGNPISKIQSAMYDDNLKCRALALVVHLRLHPEKTRGNLMTKQLLRNLIIIGFLLESDTTRSM